MQKSRQKSPSGHHRTILSGYIFATEACIDNWKKNLLSSNMSSRCPTIWWTSAHLAAEISSGVWRTATNFNWFCVLAALLHGTPAVGVNQTLRRWTDGATYIRHGEWWPSRWALAHILVSVFGHHGCLPYFHTWCGLSANIRCRSETCCTRLAENTGRKKVAKNRHLGTIAQFCRAISLQLRHVSTIGKKTC